MNIMFKLKNELRKPYEELKERLIVQVVNTEKNREMLEEVPHREVADLSLVYGLEFDEFTGDGEFTATCALTNDMLKGFGVSAEQLHEDAMENAKKKFPATVQGLAAKITEMLGEEMPEGQKEAAYVATCRRGYKGAACVFYPGFMEVITEQLGDVFIIPSSIHEMLLLPKAFGMPAEEVAEMHRSVNLRKVDEDEFLSDNIYQYDTKTRTFSTVKQ